MALTKVKGHIIADDLALGGNPTTSTQSTGNNTTRLATTAFVQTELAALVDSSPSALNTLNELAAALGDDASFSTTVTDSIALKAPLASPTFTGNIAVGGTVDGRDVAADGTKLDTIETSSTADQTGAEIKALYEAETNAYTDTLNTKLNAIEALADVTDATNVTAAGALMDSELTDIASVKALNQGIATTDDPTFTNTKLAAIAASNTDTAVDVFVYDTRKDSDGGAWRKRTQHTSWYNETLNTSTRGARKEFPCVAVIVIASNNVIIYDGDDPDMPMWMVFPSTGSVSWATGGTSTLNSTVALNGIVVISSGVGSGGGMGQYNFAKDDISVSYNSNLYSLNDRKISTGRLAKSYSAVSSGGGYPLIDSAINDIAMTVLSNAPIDADTGLPVPTIAVATNGGVSVIKDNGTVVDIINTQDSSTFNFCMHVHFRSDGGLVWSADSSGNTAAPRFIQVLHEIPSADFSHGTVASSSNIDEFYSRSTTSQGDFKFLSALGVKELQNSTGATHVGTLDGLSSFAYNKTIPEEGLGNYITSDYNTGWMNGDIKLATLSDTDTTSIPELITNGTFDSDISGWSSGANAVLSHSSSGIANAATGYNSYAYIDFTLTAGKQYIFRADITSDSQGSGGNPRIAVTETASDSTFLGSTVTSGVGSYYVTFTATGATRVRLIKGSNSGTTIYDNVSLRLAEPDRSVNGKGLQVFGTITKTAVATGADLVAYSGFSASNYLKQPYNSDFNFGTGDFSVMGWAYITNTGVSNPLFGHGNDGVNDGFIIGLDSVGLNIGILGMSSFLSALGTPPSFSGNTWNQVCYKRENAMNYAYLNGKLEATWGGGLATANFTTLWSSPVTTLGKRASSGADPSGRSLALWRVSATVPTDEQIAKIYNDEKYLFQENAKATLYGTSDAVTALAYDDATELLHVGTSAGRSEFQGLRRINNTTDAVGAAISASNGLVAED